MKGLAPLFLGIFGTFAFSWVGLTVIPNWQIGHLNPQSDEEGTDTYPQPQSGMFERGARVYAANGCAYCHTQQVRADYAGADIERKWGTRRSAPRDYIFEQPVFLSKMRMGQDIANIGARARRTAESSSSWCCIYWSFARTATRSGGLQSAVCASTFALTNEFSGSARSSRDAATSGSIAFTSRLSGKTSRCSSATSSCRFAVTCWFACDSSIALSRCPSVKTTCTA